MLRGQEHGKETERNPSLDESRARIMEMVRNESSFYMHDSMATSRDRATKYYT